VTGYRRQIVRKPVPDHRKEAASYHVSLLLPAYVPDQFAHCFRTDSLRFPCAFIEPYHLPATWTPDGVINLCSALLPSVPHHIWDGLAKEALGCFNDSTESNTFSHLVLLAYCS
jgi:hypothetical protein